MRRPTPQEYQVAIQHPNICFNDYELRDGAPVLDALSLPRQISGNFASVYQITTHNKIYAARCFLRDVPDIEERYQHIDNYLNQVKLPYFVEFDYLEKSNLVNGKWYPILKLEWINGVTLDVYIEKNKHNSEKIKNIAEKFFQMMSELKRYSLSHGDLHHGNILVENDNLRLIDYDAMYVPSLQGWDSSEIGHQNYQHPYRDYKDFGLYVDNFSEWIIYTSLLSFAKNSNLWDLFDCGDDCLLFRQVDLNSPHTSKVFELLQDMADEQINNLVSNIQYYLYSTNLPQIPSIIEKTPTMPSVEIIQEIRRTVVAPTESDMSWIWDQKPVIFHHIYTPVLVERFLIMGYFLLLLVVFLAYFTNTGHPTIVILSPVFSLSMLLIFLDFRFHKIPIVREKNKTRRVLKSVQQKLKEHEKHRIEIQNKLEKIYTDQEKEIENIKKRQQKNRIDEKNEIMDVRRNLNLKIRPLINEIRNLSGAESRELSNELSRIKNIYVEKVLSRHRIRNAIIPGIGPGLSKRLSSRGINTAADFVDFVVYYYNNPNGEAFLKINNGQNIRVYGIGPQKASALQAWRNSLLSRYSGEIPKQLSNSEVNRIKSKYRMKIQSLNDGKKSEENIASKEILNISRKYISKNKLLSSEITNIYEKNTDEINKFGDELQELNITYKKIKWELDKNEHSLKSFKFITFRSFIIKIF